MDRGRILLLIFDGLGDRPTAALGNRTPLQAASTPNLDWFAANGITGQLDPIAPGIRPGSDTSHLALFGYDPVAVYTGRGPFEAAGVGIEVREGDIAFRANFCTVDEKMRVVDRRAGRIRERTKDLAAAIGGLRFGDIEVLFGAGTEHRGALVLRGPGLSSAVSDTDPHEEGKKVLDAQAIEARAKKTALIVNRLTKKVASVLGDHPVNVALRKAGRPPANMIVLRGAGVVPHLEPLGKARGVNAAAIAGVSLVKGICRAVGMAVLDVRGATGGLDTDMNAKAEAALAALRKYDMVVVNVKAADICGHDGKAREKVEVAERIDVMMGHIRAGLNDDVVVAATADHSTPVDLRDHSGDPVPVLVYGPTVRVDTVKRFDELSVMAGGLGRIRGTDLLPILLSDSNGAEKFGA